MATPAEDSMMDDEILTMFVEDTKEHLGGIEASLTDLGRAAGSPDPELINKVFRAAHSIKGGAGFLGLKNIRDLAHKLENILHLIRNGEIAPDSRIVSRLLAGFDTLMGLVGNAPGSDAEDISDQLGGLTNLTEELLPETEKGAQLRTVPIALPGGATIFTEDALSLIQALKGGHFLYLVEYDLIHDVHAQKKTPLDVIKAMESSGLIVDSKVDLAAAGDLDAPPTNTIPFYVLFATIVEPDIVSYLFAITPERIHRIDLDPAVLAAHDPRHTVPASACAGQIEPLADWSETVGTCTAIGRDTLVEIDCPGGLTVETVADLRRALLLALERGREVRLLLQPGVACDLAGLQLLCSACMSFAEAGKAITLSGDGASEPAALALRAGLGSACRDKAASCILRAG